ncbi:MAG: hypothetical protein HY709_06645 [Candidatus Latescibacteria bacterium]|nr:hypothetical protein [Candidatus Latescibacterota bacterium]
MSYMFEVYYKVPPDMKKEAALTDQVLSLGGRLSYRENPEANSRGSVCLTYEFDNLEQAEIAAELLRQLGEYVEGPADYGPVVAASIVEGGA